MKHKQLCAIILLLIIATTSNCMESQANAIQQLAIIKPFFNKLRTITTLTNAMDEIENNGRSYPDYDKRTGLIFSEFWVKTAQPEKIIELPRRKILTLVGDELQGHSAQSSFDYPKIQRILTQEILPKTFKCIEENKWAPLPKKLFAQLYLQRCHTGDPMNWHQDPGEYYDTMADFSLVLMLSKQDDPVNGWMGGEFKVKAGLPGDAYNETDVKTIIHEYNQGVLFNNQINSHAVTAVLSNLIKSKRDLLVVPLYFEKQPMPIPDTSGK